VCADRDGNTPLHLATVEREVSMVGLLLEYGGDGSSLCPHLCSRVCPPFPSALPLTGWASVCSTLRDWLRFESTGQRTAKNREGKTAYDIAKIGAERVYGTPEHAACESLQKMLFVA
jgi:ankyrin repeat protein